MHETAPGATSLAGTAFPATSGVQGAVACAAAAVGRFDCDKAGTVNEGNDGASLAGAAFPTTPNPQDPVPLQLLRSNASVVTTQTPSKRANMADLKKAEKREERKKKEKAKKKNTSVR